MAQRNRSSRTSRGSSSGRSTSRSTSSRTTGRSSSRGGSGRGAPTKSNAGPTIAAVGIVVVAIVLLAVVMGTGNKKDDKERSATPRAPRRTFKPAEEKPQAPTRLAPPSLAPEAKGMAEALVEEARKLAAQGEALYQEANAAKKAGDDDLWQSKLKEAAPYYREIMDAYNDLISQMPTNQDWDEEQVANYYLGSQGSQIQKYLSRLTDIQKQRRR